MDKKPNLFFISTKEFALDAFVAWLLEMANPIKWNDPDNDDINLNACAKDFIKFLIIKFLEMKGKKNDSKLADLEIDKVKVDHQWKKIDISAAVSGKNGKYFIIIEDKTFAEHDNPLATYIKNAEKLCVEEDLGKLICIYLKTGPESKPSRENIEKRGFKYIDRSDLIKFFEKHNKIKNDIYIDFVENLEKTFETEEIQKWNDNCWIGLGDYLKNYSKLKIEEWKNLKGWFHINWETHTWKKYRIFLQIDEHKQFDLCFKISDDCKKISTEIAQKFQDKLMENKNEKYKIEKTSLKSGKYMVVAKIKNKDWLLTKNDGTIDKDATIKELTKYEELLRNCIS